MEATTTSISATDLKNVLDLIQGQEHQVSIRFRTIGRLWQPNFLRILKIDHDRSVLFHDDTRKQLIQLPDYSAMVQFELDGKLYPFEPNCHYQISEEKF